MKYLFSLVAAGALLLGISSTMRAQTEVTLLAPNPFRGSLDKVAPGFQSKTGYKLKLTYGKGLGTRRQVARGEIFDVSILLPPYPEALASGNIDPKSATTLASLTLALAVKKGTPKPDISTPKALRQALLAAKTIAFVDPTAGSDGFATPVKVVAFISTHVRDAKAAKALVDYLSSPDAEASYTKDGMEPAR